MCGRACKRMPHFLECDETVQRVMQPGSRNERPRKISAHLPIDPHDLTGSGRSSEPPECRFRKLNGPARICVVADDKGGLAKRMYPLGHIMEILAIAIPLQVLVEGLSWIALLARFSNPQPTRCWMKAAALLIAAADPAGAHVIGAKPAQPSMHLIDEFCREAAIFLIPRALEQFEEIADRERVGPR